MFRLVGLEQYLRWRQSYFPKSAEPPSRQRASSGLAVAAGSLGVGQGGLPYNFLPLSVLHQSGGQGRLPEVRLQWGYHQATFWARKMSRISPRGDFALAVHARLSEHLGARSAPWCLIPTAATGWFGTPLESPLSGMRKPQL